MPMTRTHRIRPKNTNAPTLVHSREFTALLADRRFGGMAVVEYLFDLFAASPLELFSRLSVLTVLDQVKKDKSLFPDGAQTFDPPTPARASGHALGEVRTAATWLEVRPVN